MTRRVLQKRTAEFARRVSGFTKPLLRSIETQDEARQLRRAANGINSNYRATGVSRSHREFTAKMGVVLEEADESVGWLEHFTSISSSQDPEEKALLNEAQQLRKIFSAAYWTARGNDKH